MPLYLDLRLDPSDVVYTRLPLLHPFPQLRFEYSGVKFHKQDLLSILVVNLSVYGFRDRFGTNSLRLGKLFDCSLGLGLGFGLGFGRVRIQGLGLG